MAKNDTKTIFNVLNAKAQKKTVTNTDKKEVRQAIANLSEEISNGYKIGQSDLQTLKSVFESYKDDVNAAFSNLPAEQQLAMFQMLKDANQTSKGEETAVLHDEARPAAEENSPAGETPAEPASGTPSPAEENSPAEPAPYDLSVLEKDPKEMTADDRKELEKILDSADRYAPEYARAASLMGQLEQAEAQPEENAAPEGENAQPEENAAPEPETQAASIAEMGGNAQESATPAAPAPESQVEPATPEEKGQLLDNIRNSNTIVGYTVSISPKIKPAQIEASMALNTAEGRAEALANPDDLLLAADYCEKGGRNSDINEVIAVRLAQYNMDSITPDNAFVLLALADKIKGNGAVYDAITQKIADALKKYDAENFGTKLSEKELSANYTEAVKALNKFKPHTVDKNGNQTSTLNTYTFTDGKGSPLYDKSRGILNPRRWASGKGNDASKNKEAILNMARELAAQELAKTGLAKDPKKRAEQLNKAMNEQLEKLLSSPDGKKVFSQSEIAARMAVAHTSGETFKNRVSQRFHNSKWGKTLSTRLNKLDKQLTETYGENYVKAKKYTKMVSKIGYESLKGAAQFAIAGLANPVGIPALIAYNTYKQWKTISPQLKDPSISKWKKAAIVAGASVTTSLGMISAATGLSGVVAAAGLDNPAIVQLAVNAGNTLGIWGRTAVSTLASSLPSGIERYLLNRKDKQLAKQIEETRQNNGNPPQEKIDAFNAKKGALQAKIDAAKKDRDTGGNLWNITKNLIGVNDRAVKKLENQMAELDTQKPKNLKELIAEQKYTASKIAQNKDELIARTIGSATGIGLAQSGVIPNLVNHLTENAAAAFNGTVSQIAAAPDTPPAPAGHGDNPWEQAASDYKAPWQNPDYDPSKAPWQQDGSHHQADNSDSGIHTPYRPGIEPSEPSEISGIKPEQNLEAAKAENSSGLEGKSAYAHTVQHLESLGDSRLDPQAVAEKMSEQLGAKANLGTIACKMAPYALQEALQLDLPEGQTPSTHNMIQYISEHGIPAEKMDAFNQFMNNNFEGAQFKTENFASYNPSAAVHAHHVNTAGFEEHVPSAIEAANREISQHSSAQDIRNARLESTGTETDSRILAQFKKIETNGITFEATDKDPLGRGTIGGHTHAEAPQQTEISRPAPQQQTEIYSAPDPMQLYAEEHGYTDIRPAPLELQAKLDHNRYSGIYQTYKDEVYYRYGQAYTRTVPAEVICVPHNPNEDLHVYESYRNARESSNHGIGAFEQTGHARQCFGSGMIIHGGSGVGKVIQAIDGISRAAEGVAVFADAIKRGRG